jgi:hypothetical protein
MGIAKATAIAKTTVIQTEQANLRSKLACEWRDLLFPSPASLNSMIEPPSR